MTARRWTVIGLLATALAACTAGTSSPATSAVPSVGPSKAGASAAAASPGPDRTQALVRRFLERVRDPDARYRVDQTLTLVVGEASSEAVTHTDVAGDDRLIVSDSTVGGQTTHTEFLQADGLAYQRQGDEDWRAVDPGGVEEPPFPFLEPTHMRYAGREVKGGELLESFSLVQTIPIGTAVAESLGVMGGQATIVVFDCYLRTDGTPAHVEFGFQLSAADGSAAGTGAIVQAYAEFGGDITIEPPVG